MACRFCNGETGTFMSDSDLGGSVVLCPACKLYMVDGTQKEILEKNTIYEKKYWQNDNTPFEKRYKDFESLKLEIKWKSQVEFFKPKGKILEIGAGRGQSMFFFYNSGYNISGIEPDQYNVERINRIIGNHCIAGYAETFETKRTFDVVWMSHVLEHTSDPYLAVNKIYDVLNPGGMFFVEVPNCYNYHIAKSSFDGNPSSFGFTLESLINICDKFKMVKTGCYSTHITLPDYVKRGIKKYTHLLNRPYYHYKEIPNGDNMRILFRKN